jgi:hypothetical protein
LFGNRPSIDALLGNRPSIRRRFSQRLKELEGNISLADQNLQDEFGPYLVLFIENPL